MEKERIRERKRGGVECVCVFVPGGELLPFDLRSERHALSHLRRLLLLAAIRYHLGCHVDALTST